MPKIASSYKNKVSVIVLDSLNNYINSENNPEENEFRRWLKPKKLYYLSRIVNEVVKKKCITNIQVQTYAAIEVYKIMERDYEPTTTEHKNTDTRDSIGSV